MFHGEFESMKMINDIVPDFSPKPLSWGKCKASARHFILFEYHALRKGDPPIPRFTYAISQLHTLSLNANLHGKFGFHITTYNGTLAQDNTWTDTWEEFYSRGMKRMLQIDAEARGASDEIEQLAVPLLAKVIPRLLRPLENGGREIKPVLIHGDLWLGNVSVKDGSDDPLMFDASAFWGHNECMFNPVVSHSIHANTH
jgi:protein-ribulosamine 3-kinase